jgi:GTP cyclohydrolase I
MNKMDHAELPDMQNSDSCISLAIQRVGITNLKIPIYISEKDGGFQNTVAEVDVFVDLEACSKGTHMSRLAIGVQKFIDHRLNSTILAEISQYIRHKLKAKTAEVIYRFPYFIKKIAPESKEPGLVYHNITFDLTSEDNDPKNSKFKMSIETTATSLCPCSKEISDSSAHNQRSKIKLTVIPKNGTFVWIEDLVKISENCASCEVYSALKRVDEKHVTERAYSNPKFVEDMVREIYQALQARDDISWFMVEVTNEESIHQHNAYAKMISE